MNMQKLVLDYLPLANSIAKKYSEKCPKHVSIEELRSAAYMGLVDAAMKFDASKNVGFGAYARFRISGEVKDHLKSLIRIAKVYANNSDFDCPKSECSETDEFFDFVTEKLGDSDGKIMKMYYVENRTLKEIGSIRGVGESRISQIIKDCHRRLKLALA